MEKYIESLRNIKDDQGFFFVVLVGDCSNWYYVIIWNVKNLYFTIWVEYLLYVEVE